MKKQNCRSGCCFLGAAALHSDVCLLPRLGLEPAASTSADFLTWIFSSKTTSITESHNQGKHQHNKHKNSLTQTHTQYSYFFGSLIADFVAWISLEVIPEKRGVAVTLDHSQSLFYFVPQENLTDKLARLGYPPFPSTFSFIFLTTRPGICRYRFICL